MKPGIHSVWILVGFICAFYTDITAAAAFYGSIEAGAIYNNNFNGYFSNNVVNPNESNLIKSETIGVQSILLGYSMVINPSWMIMFHGGVQHSTYKQYKELINNSYNFHSTINYRFQRRYVTTLTLGRQTNQYDESDSVPQIGRLTVQDSESISYKLGFSQRLSFRTLLFEKFDVENINFTNSNQTIAVKSLLFGINWRALKNLYLIFNIGHSLAENSSNTSLERTMSHIGMGLDYKFSTSLYLRSQFSKLKNRDNNAIDFNNSIASVRIGYQF